jgi:hypothetical protein
VPIFGKKKPAAVEILSRQAARTQEALLAFRDFAKEPASAHIDRARRALELADSEGLAAIESSRAEPDRFAGPAADAARRIGELGERLGRCLEEIPRFDVPADDALQSIAEALERSGCELALSLRSFGRSGDGLDEAVVRAKRWANLAAARVRETEAALLERGEVVPALKSREILKHLLDGAACADEAADLIGDLGVLSR